MERDSQLGRVLGGTYRLDAALGRGGMGAVYRAVHLRTGRPYAVKVLLPEIAGSPAALRRFEREARAVSALGHAGIVAIHDFARAEDGLSYIVMDLLEGEDLAARMERLGAMAWAEAARIFDEIGSALQAAHGIGIVHRDLKPANVFLARPAGAPERAVLLDFGLAKMAEAEGVVSKLTTSGVVMGTPQYMSPEQAQGQEVDGRSDLYALATILFEMVTGRIPFAAPTPAAFFAKLLTAPAPAVSALVGARVPPGLDTVLSRALAKDPAERYQEAGALRAAVAALPPPPSGPFRSASLAETGAAQVVPPMEAVSAVAPTEALPTPIRGEARVLAAGSDPAASRVSLLSAEAAPPATSGRRWVVVAAVLAALASALVATWVTLVVARHPGPGAGGSVAKASAPARAAPTATSPSPPASPPPATLPSDEAGEPPPAGPLAGAGGADAGEAAGPSGSAPRAEASPRRGPRTIDSSGPAALSPPPPPPSPPSPAGPGGPPSAGSPGMDRAIERMGVRDYRGCLEALRSEPSTVRVLATRMSCAQFAGDRAELERTCAELRGRYPDSTYTRTCEQLASLPR